jgi:hypothetical protein
LLTEERNLLALARRKRRALSLAGAIALVGLFAFTLAVWQFGGGDRPKPDKPVVDPRASAISEAVEQYGVPPPSASPPMPEAPQPPASEPEEREADAEAPRPDAHSAFLTLRTNLPARVYIDGARVARRTPLVKYPVKPGNRLIVLEAQSTKERAEFRLRFERGQHRTIDQNFESTPRR